MTIPGMESPAEVLRSCTVDPAAVDLVSAVVAAVPIDLTSR